MATHSSAQVTRMPHAGVDLAQLVRPELVKFTAHDGLELSGWLYRPPGATGPGAVRAQLPRRSRGPGAAGVPQRLPGAAGAGIGVFAPNVRGSSGFGKKFVNLDNGELRFDGVKDIKASVDYLVSRGSPTRGGSASPAARTAAT